MNFAGVKAITIPEGKVKKITAGGVVLWEEAASEIFETVIPHIAPRSTWFDSLGSNGVLTLNASNTEGALGVSTPNSYAYTDRNSKTFYLMPIDGKYNKATLNYSATDGLAVKYYLQAIKDNGGKFTAVATVGKGSNNVIEWVRGFADYLLISIEHSDGTSRWDWNSAGKTISVTFSGSANQLPSEYQQVEYVQNSISSQTSGTYLDLGFAFDTSATFYINYVPPSNGSAYLFGAAENSGALRCMITENPSNTTLYGSTGSAYNTAVSAFNNGDTIIKCVLKNGLSRIENLSNNKSGETSSQKAYTMTSSLFLFAQNYNGSARLANNGTKIKAFSSYDKTDTLICDLVPCYRKSDGVIGMYDLVRKLFLTNAGSGTFTKGADV